MSLTASYPRPLRSAKDRFFRAGAFRTFAEHLTGKREARALHAHCAKTGVGMADFSVCDATKRAVYFAIVDGNLREGLFFEETSDAVVATLRAGKVTSDTAGLAAQLGKVLKTIPTWQPVVWAGPARTTTTAKTPSLPALTAKRLHDLTSLAETKSLSKTARAQLAAAATELSGKRTLAAMFAWLAATDQSVTYVELREGKAPRYDAWLLGSRDDGVFFDHGKTKPNGMAMSQRNVHDMTKAKRTALAAQLGAGLKGLRP